MRGAPLGHSGTNPARATLSSARRAFADRTGAGLRGTHLGYANLSGALATAGQLDKALGPQGATMPDGTKRLSS